ncbi:putative transcription factor [Lachnellula suecica]|uniref:Putative transcription factor kapC n=1 Tax=Lachnellula suecica TaxID=602035 RepID=A0A8T9CFG9_9HELO|nr:putative transcription factor [Lachnellula suecica]
MQSIAPAPMPQSMQNQDMSADNDLRAQLAAVISTQQHAPHGYNEVPASSSASPHDHNIDPAIGGPGSGGMMSTAGDSGGDDMGDGRKGGKRELSQSKRAAQNRAAQRAFRQRKEGYIKKLEEQVREMHALEENYKGIQSENYSLREYIIHLQSRLIESQGEYPQPPPNVDLRHPHARPQHEHMDHPSRHEGAPVAPMSSSMGQLNASAARNLAAAGLNSGKHVAPEEHGGYEHKRYKDSAAEEAADEEIIRSQLQASADGLPTSMSM